MIGVVFGFVNTTILQPLVLNIAQIGLLRVILSYSTLLSTIFSLGYNQVAAHVFPKMHDPDSKHRGFLFISFSIMLLGFLLSLGVFYVLKTEIVQGSEINLETYVFAIVPIVFFMLLYNFLDGYQVQLKKPLQGTFLKEIIFRVFVSLIFLSILFNWLDFENAFWLYSVALMSPGILLLFFVFFQAELDLKLPTSDTWKAVRPIVIPTMLYGALNNSTYILLRELDIVMLKELGGLSETGIYSTLFYFGLLVSIPSRSLRRASWSSLAFAWEKNDLDQIQDIYRKSCLNQLILGGLLFLGVWLNVDFILGLMPNGAKFEEGKLVVLFIGLLNLVNMGIGVNSEIILTSKYYKLNFIMSLSLVFLIFVLNLYFIPKMGAVGAGIGTFLAFCIYNLVRIFFLKAKFRFQPFSWRTLLVIGIIGFVYFASSLYLQFAKPLIESTFINLIINSIIISSVYIGLVRILKPSKELNDRANFWLEKMKIRK